MGTPMMLKGTINGEVFLAHVEQCLVPTLNSSDIIVMNKVPSHKVERLRKTIDAVGARLRDQPPYSSDPGE